MWRRNIGLELQDLLGEGGQGRVFKALRRDSASGLAQTVAVKILHSEIAVETWKNEFESLSRVRSPYCVKVHSFERIERRPALVLEFVDGVSLAALAKSCWLETEECEEILAQLESAILDLHKYGMFHGDLSPQNILIDREGHLRLLDFGYANSAGAINRCTPDFAAPERLRGEPATLASDIFSLGRLEEFLRGKNVDSTDYIERRVLRGRSPDVARQEILGARVREYQNHRARQSQTRTESATAASLLSRRFIAMIFMALLLPLIVPAATLNPLARPLSELRIRTQAWHQFRINGVDVGYAPLNFPVEAGKTYRLEWISAHGNGQRTLKIPAKATLRLKDRDFSH